MSESIAESPFTIRPTHDEIVERCATLIKRARERGIRVQEADHPWGPLCNCCRCFSIHHMGGSSDSNRFDGSDWLQGQNFTVLADWNTHRARYEKVYAQFAGLGGEVFSLDVTRDVLGDLENPWAIAKTKAAMRAAEEWRKNRKPPHPLLRGETS